MVIAIVLGLCREISSELAIYSLRNWITTVRRADAGATRWIPTILIARLSRRTLWCLGVLSPPYIPFGQISVAKQRAVAPPMPRRKILHNVPWQGGNSGSCPSGCPSETALILALGRACLLRGRVGYPRRPLFVFPFPTWLPFAHRLNESIY